MKHSELAERWATQSHDKGAAGNMWFKGREVFSYGARIGRLVPTARKDQPLCALISAEKFSDSTTAMQNLARGAAEQAGLFVFLVKTLVGHEGNYTETRAALLTNVKAYEARIHEQLAWVARGRVTSADHYRRQAQAILMEATAFSRAFKLAWSWKGPAIETVRHPKEEA